MKAPVYMALVHHPVLDKTGATVTTAITNLDVHDLARSARTYGLAGYFVVTPISAQRAILDRILAHWGEGGPGRKRVPERGEALSRVRPVDSIEEAIAQIEADTGQRPRIVATAARSKGQAPVSWAAGSAALREGPTLLLFGTGRGLVEETLASADLLLAPIRPGGYNHLSVRAAAAITLDRLFGDGDPDEGHGDGV